MLRRLGLFIISNIIWYLLTWPYNFGTHTMDWLIFIAGGIFSLIVAILFVDVFTKHPRKLFNPVRYFWFLCYVPLLFYYMLIANFDVVYRVIHPKLLIKPGIVKVKTRLTSESARTALANSITLTPGTLTVDITDDGYLYVHWINVKFTDTEGATKKIVSRFENILERIFD